MAYRDSTRHRRNSDGKLAAAMTTWGRHEPPADGMGICAACLTRIHHWHVPPNWSARDWFEEMQREAVAAAVQAMDGYDTTRGVPLGRFLYGRILE